ncbi:hypothetical protein [Mesorhizobium sp. B2-6-5]|uniref:DUF6931 family protein n=1 Tax=Mesorhizobium sp. B2-6-5 TaxID=2589912 RepID=UPI0015E2D7F9|nr:hypothetical protein [Mesorhizobium sp. B2-6-5]
MRTPPTEQHSIAFCRFLLAGRVPEEAIAFRAYLLPERAEVWCAHECLSQLGHLFDETDHELLGLVRDWVSEPESPSHRADLKAAVAKTLARAFTQKELDELLPCRPTCTRWSQFGEPR